RVYWYQHKAGIRTVVDRLRKCVTDSKTQRLLYSLVQIDQQAVISRVPARIGFEENPELGVAKSWNRDSAIEQTRPTRSQRAQGCVVESPTLSLAARIRLIHVEKAAQVHAAHSKIRRSKCS